MEAGPTVDSDQLECAEEYRRRRATAVLCPVFGDIVDSTVLLEELGDPVYYEIRQIHDQTIRSVIERDDEGIVLQTYGDGFLAVFSEPSTAVERSLEVQQLLDPRRASRKDRAARSRFRLRIGIDMGQVAVKRASGIVAEVFGRHVNRASRIESQARPGSVLASFPVYDSSVGWLRDAVRWTHYPPVQLKGFADPISVHEPVGIATQDVDQSEATMTEVVLRRPLGSPPDAAGDQTVIAETKYGGWMDEPTIRSAADPFTLALDSISRSARRMRLFRMGRRPRIVWVDDFPENNTHLVRQLTEAGLRIETARDTSSALAALRMGRLAAVISDMGRGANATAGLELLRQMRESSIQVPALIFTSPTAEAEHGAAAMELGASVCTSGTVSLLRSLDTSLRS